MSGVQQGSVLRLHCSSVHLGAFSTLLENNQIGYSTLIAVVPSPGIRVTVAESLKHDLSKGIEWFDFLGGMKLKSKTKTMIVSRSCTMYLVSSDPHYLLAEWR